ncbi:MAG: hypothetical protein ACI82Z_001924 [Cellvibrionaceae bacterium]|jgi:hypothetical protein
MKKTISILLPIIISFVFLQSLPFKFSNSLETQHIFSTLADWSGLQWFGSYGGYIVGTFELVASLMLLVPLVFKLIGKPIAQPLLPLGALLALGIMTGAIYFHLFTPLGIVQPYFDAQTATPIGDDSPGILFVMACIAWLSALVLVLMDLSSKESYLKGFLGKS